MLRDTDISEGGGGSLRSRGAALLRRAHGSDPLLWIVLALAHITPIVVGGLIARDTGFGDVRLYWHWVNEGLDGQGWPVIDKASVYPFGALLPMIVLAPFKTAGAYLFGWFAMTLLLNVIVLIMIENYERPSRTASWWWVLSIACLGPVAISRLESIVVPLTVIAVLVLAKRPAVAAALLTFAGWIKVFPMVWLIPLVLYAPKKAGRIIASSALVSAALVVPVLLLGGGSRIFGFLSTQTGRGLQIESVPASILQIGRLWGEGPRPIYSTQIVTWQFDTHPAEVLGHVATMLTVPAVLGTLALIGVSLRRAPERRLEILAAGLFATTLALIVFNQVGSPQYMAWVSAAVILGLLSRSAGDRTWRMWAAIILVMDAMTQAIYPHFYPQLIRGEPIMLLMLVGRNVLLVVLFVAAIRWLMAIRPALVRVPA